MKIEKFEDIISWQKSKELALAVYRMFKTNKDYSFREQLQRAAVSIGNNIAEGYERKTNNEFKQFLYIAKGSSGEVRSMLQLALELKYLNQSDYNKLLSLCTEISRLLSGLIKTL